MSYTDYKKIPNWLWGSEKGEKIQDILLLGASLVLGFILSITQYILAAKFGLFISSILLLASLVVGAIIELFRSSLHTLSVFLIFTSSISFINYIILLSHRAIGLNIMIIVFLIMCLYMMILLLLFSNAFSRHSEEENKEDKAFVSTWAIILPSSFFVGISLLLKYSISDQLGYSSISVSLLITAIFSIYTYITDNYTRKNETKFTIILFSVSLLYTAISCILLGIAKNALSNSSWTIYLSVIYFFFCASIIMISALFIPFLISILRRNNINQLSEKLEKNQLKIKKFAPITSAILLIIGVILLFSLSEKPKRSYLSLPIKLFSYSYPTIPKATIDELLDPQHSEGVTSQDTAKGTTPQDTTKSTMKGAKGTTPQHEAKGTAKGAKSAPAAEDMNYTRQLSGSKELT
ncbi:hypothetical protein NEFER03_1795 [Nematocida sp. LUAm3]|nr:hypothetical protein NEFER03_1795 [Nematocida sp. LUAm3]KAI5173898.1 hypothetical protein NEFER02_0365 [Nematocida sp. LUAm2]KAI5177357.1 hypothetical protein NEFER01_0632 [Nematocida sp. LUAm1]